jgi:hypothetical protein
MKVHEVYPARVNSTVSTHASPKSRKHHRRFSRRQERSNLTISPRREVYRDIKLVSSTNNVAFRACIKALLGCLITVFEKEKGNIKSSPLHGPGTSIPVRIS